MKLKERILIAFSTIFWGIILFWLIGSPLFFFLPVIGIIYVFIGGLHHA
jgi:hypothetical protein